MVPLADLESYFKGVSKRPIGLSISNKKKLPAKLRKKSRYKNTPAYEVVLRCVSNECDLEPPVASFHPNKQNIQAGIVVLIDGYDLLTSVIGLIQGVRYAHEDETMNPGEGLYYTGIYRWALRTLDLLPHWIRGNFHNALSVWNNRFKFMDAQVPPWLKKLLPWISEESWNIEKGQLEKYRKQSELAFTPFYRFPSKTFNNFNSFLPDSEAFIFSSARHDEFTTTTTPPTTDIGETTTDNNSTTTNPGDTTTTAKS